jgi:6-phosphofructo-2-kinase
MLRKSSNTYHSGINPATEELRSVVARNVSIGVEPTYTTNSHTVLTDRVLIAMVGLPARGKSYISKAIVRYLQFIGCPARLFNAGNKRRQEGASGVGAGFFDASNMDAKAQRERMAMDTLDEALEWIRGVTSPEAGCACGIFDATNTTIARREKVRQRLRREHPPVRLIFLELVCRDDAILQDNYRMKLSNDDYKGTDPEAALRDFQERVRQYERVYEPVDDAVDCRPLTEAPAEAKAAGVAADVEAGVETGVEAGVEAAAGAAAGAAALLPGCIQMIDAGRKLIVTQCEGFVVNELLSLLHSIHLGRRCIWITLVGETSNDLQGVLGGDSSLSTDGLEYARAVREHVLARERSDDLRDAAGQPPAPAMVLTGTLRRNVQMAEVICADEDELPFILRQKTSPLSRSGLGGSREGLDRFGDHFRGPERDTSTTSPSSPPRSPPPASDAQLAAASVVPSATAPPEGRRRGRISLQLHRLNELCAGKLDSLTYEQMRQLYAAEYQARETDKLNYRYPGPGGESYMDLILRLESIILSIEQTRGNVIIPCDRAVCRVLLCYFSGGVELHKLPYLEVGPGVIELRRSHSGFSTMHTPISSGRTTRAAGPGTSGAAELQWSNRLSSSSIPVPPPSLRTLNE